MFFTYIGRELRRRAKQSLIVAAGLGVGIALVITVSSASAGVKSAQGKVLQSLYGVGTDMTVTKTSSPQAGGGGQHFGFGGSGSGSGTGTARKLSQNALHTTPGSATLTVASVSKVSSLTGVSAASGALSLTDTSFSGTIPTGSTTSGGPPSGTPASSSSGTSSSSGATGGASFDVNSFTVDGVAIGSTVGPLSASDVTSGSYFSSADTTAKVAVISSSYAKQKGLEVGSTLKVGSGTVKVIGIAQLSSGAADVYLPLATAQKLAGLEGKITTVFVSASSATGVSAIASEVKAALPTATVSTSSDLAKQVSGALASASTLASSLGRWLSVAALAVASLLAGLLMMAAVSRRVREFGTLKAIGWRTRRIVAQVMGEGIALGILGGIFGIVLGVAGALAISAVAPSLSATIGNTSLGGGFPGGGGGPAGVAETAIVHLTAPLQAGTIAVALLLALAGGLVAGAFGAWRAARLRPAAALRSVQ
jgi:ABC-type lipoprotein release transport system permease subunit